MLHVLSIDDLSLSLWVGLENAVNDSKWLFQIRVRLEERRLSSGGSEARRGMGVPVCQTAPKRGATPE